MPNIKTKKIVHIDLNCFFAQAEILRDPSLKGLPIAVGWRNVLSTCSYEARAYGVKSAMTFKDARLKCPDLIIVDSHYEYYEKLSDEFFSYLKSSYPILEVASIDECYIDMTSNILSDEKMYEEDYLKDLQYQIYNNLSLKCSIGLGDTKFLAKMASDYKKPLGITIIHKDDIKDKLYPLSISDLYGVGRSTSKALKALNINTIEDFVNYNSEKLHNLLGSDYMYLISCLNGKSTDEVITIRAKPKSISTDRTFSNPTSDLDEILEMEKYCLKECYKKMLLNNAKSKTVLIKYRTTDFVTKTKRISSKNYMTDINQFYMIIENFFRENYSFEPLRLVGVGLENLSYEDTSSKEEELKLF